MSLCTVADMAARYKNSKRQVVRLVDHEGLPAIVLSVGQSGRRTLRFDMAAVLAWEATRQERDRKKRLDYSRHARRPAGGAL